MRLSCITDMRKRRGVQCIQIVQFAICLKPNAAKKSPIQIQNPNGDNEKNSNPIHQKLRGGFKYGDGSRISQSGRGQLTIWPNFPKNYNENWGKRERARV